MAKYNIKWDGIDRGHEGLWCPQIWIMPLQALSKFGSFDYDDITHKAYKYLGTSAPEVSWFSEEPSGSRRSLFRDNREPWASTNVISFSGKVMQLSDLGCQIVKGDISYCQVLVQVMSQWKEFDEHPFKILAHAFLELGMYRGIDFDDVVKIMQNYRIGDDLDSALATEIETMPGVAVRRLKAMLLLMTISGAIINVKGRYFAQNISYLKVILEGAERNYKEEFRRWLTEVYRTKEGKTVGATTVGSTVNALLYITDAKSYPGQYDKNSTSYWYNMYHYLYGVDGPSVYTLCNKNEVLEKFNGIYAAVTDGDAPEGVDYQHFQNVLNWGRSENVRKSGWIPYAFSRYFEFLEWREAQNKPEDKKDELPSVDRLGVALKLFAEKRNIDPIEGWTSCDEWAKKVRENFAKADAGMFVAEGFDYAGFMHNFVYNVTVANSYFSKHTEEQKTEVGNFLAQNRNSPKAASWYMDESHFPQVGGSKIPGFGSGVALNFMMKVRPSEFATYSSMIDDMLAFAGLLKSPLPKDVTVEAYEQSKSLQGVVMQKMHEMGIGKAADDNSPADYLTVNEFAWWLNNGKNKDLIKEKIMGNAMKKDKPQKHKGEKALELKKGSKDDELLLRLLASLRAKPFAILAGHSGTGKSRYVKKLAYMTCNAEELRNQNQLPGNYLLLQVKPNWHDSTDLLGYRNAITEGKYQPTELIKFIFRAYQFSETPFFLCLDEMNLAPVEQYFAEFLSAMESKEPVPLNDISEKEGNLFELGCEWEDSLEYLKENGFSIPKNLFIVGTVNMDETTNQFSRKVLDRAFTIEMTDVDFANYGNVTEPSYDDTIKEETIEQLLAGEKLVKELDEEDKKEDSSLIKVQKALAATPFAIAYRFANEYTLLKRAIETFDPQGTMTLDALDQAVLMKILPRIAGERDYIEKVYGDKETVGLRSALVGKTVSLDKINEILERAKNTNANYITFWP